MVGHLLIRSWWGVTENVGSLVFADCFCQLILKLFIAIIYLNPFTKILKISFIWNRSAFTQRNQSTIPSPLNSFLDFQGNLLICIPKKPNLYNHTIIPYTIQHNYYRHQGFLYSINAVVQHWQIYQLKMLTYIHSFLRNNLVW